MKRSKLSLLLIIFMAFNLVITSVPGLIWAEDQIVIDSEEGVEADKGLVDSNRLKVTLNADIEFKFDASGPVGGNIDNLTLKSGKMITLDGQGHTLTRAKGLDSGVGIFAGGIVRIYQGAEVTIKNTTIEYTGPNSIQEQVQQLPATGAADGLPLGLFLSAAGLAMLAYLKKQG